MHMISINTGVDGIFYPPLPLKSQENEYFFSAVLRAFNKRVKISGTEYFSCVEGKLRQYVKSDLEKRCNIIDCIVDENDFSLGIKASDMESIFIISSREDKPHEPLKSRSTIFANLELQKRLFPPFHVYYLPRYDVEHDEYLDIDVDALQLEVSKIMAQEMYDLLMGK